MENSDNATHWNLPLSNKPSIAEKDQSFNQNRRVPDNLKPVNAKNQISHMRNADIDDQTVQTYGTMCTNGTMHRRTNSTSTFTANSLAQIFDFRSPLQERQLNISPTYQVVPKTISKVSRSKRYADNESLISPLGDDGDDVTTFSFDQNFSKDLLHEWSDHVKVAEDDVLLPPEPDGIYMPRSQIFKDEFSRGHEQSCLEGWVSTVIAFQSFVYLVSRNTNICLLVSFCSVLS